MRPVLLRVGHLFAPVDRERYERIAASLAISTTDLNRLLHVDSSAIGSATDDTDRRGALSAVLSMIWLLLGSGDPTKARIESYRLHQDLREAKDAREAALIVATLCIDAERKRAILETV